MKQNVFKFGEKCYLQINSSVIGSFPASYWATIIFNFCQISIIRPSFKANLRLDKRFVDDKIGVYRSLKPNDCNEYVTFINKEWKLEWTETTVRDRLIAPDLETLIDLTIKTIKHKSCTKEQNLFSCISPNLAHSPTNLQGMVRTMKKTFETLIRCRRLQEWDSSLISTCYGFWTWLNKTTHILQRRFNQATKESQEKYLHRN